MRLPFPVPFLLSRNLDVQPEGAAGAGRIKRITCAVVLSRGAEVVKVVGVTLAEAEGLVRYLYKGGGGGGGGGEETALSIVLADGTVLCSSRGGVGTEGRLQGIEALSACVRFWNAEAHFSGGEVERLRTVLRGHADAKLWYESQGGRRNRGRAATAGGSQGPAIEGLF